MKTRTGLFVMCAACGGTGPTGDDAGTHVSGDLSPLEHCVIEGGSLHEVFSVGNQHGPVTTIVAGTIIVLGSQDGSVKQWTVDGDEPDYGMPFTTAGSPVAALALGSDDVVAATSDGQLAAWKLADASSMGSRTIADITPSALSIDASRALIGTTTGQTFAVDRASGATMQLQSTLWGVATIEVAAGNRLYTAGHMYGMPQIERRTADAPAAVVETWLDEPGAGWVHAIALDKDATKLVAVGEGFVAALAPDAIANGPLAIASTGAHNAVGATLLPGNALVATAGSEGTLQLWKADTAEHVATLVIPAPIGIARDAAGTRLYTSGVDGRLHAFGCD